MKLGEDGFVEQIEVDKKGVSSIAFDDERLGDTPY